ncbi:MAG TPA: hypothetical protein VGN52_08710 [Burkholderiales bacterium]|jgi:hypothetical protein
MSEATPPPAGPQAASSSSAPAGSPSQAPGALPPPAPLSSAALLRGYLLTLAVCLLFVFFGMRPGYSVYAWLLLLPVLPWLLYNLVRGLVHPAERRRRLPKIALWVLAVAAVLGVQNHNESAARSQADAVLAHVNEYHARTKAWPAKLEDVGLDSAALRGKWRIAYRTAGDGPPLLSYAAPNMMFDAYHYDFDTRSWKYESY